MAPILPGLSDDPKKMGEVVRAARDAGATHLWASTLYLKPGTREHFLEHLARDWPEQLPVYEQLYAGRAYLPRKRTETIQQEVKRLRERHGVRDRRPHAIRPAPAVEQMRLAV
jgi:DNA repair photolyase